jgi:hypothetical protein
MSALHPEQKGDSLSYTVDIGTAPSLVDQDYSQWSAEDFSKPITRENLMAFVVWTFFFAQNDTARHQFIIRKVKEKNGFDAKRTFASVQSEAAVMKVFTPEELDFFVNTFNTIRHHPRDMEREDAGRLISSQFIPFANGSY